MPNNRFTIDLNNLKLSTAKKKEVLFKIHELVSSLDSTKVTVGVTFEESAGYCHAEHIRNGETIAQGGANTSGTISLAAAQAGDTISISGNSEGTTTVIINIETYPKTPKKYKAGRYGSGFDIQNLN